MSLTFVGAGLFDEEDISIKGYKRCKEADFVFMENYTSRLFGARIEDFEDLLDKEIDILSRSEVEKEKKPLSFAEENQVVFLVPGDPMISTTHVDLRIDAVEKGIDSEIIHGASIFTAAPGLSGLQNYKFGRSATITFRNLSLSPYDAIKQNKENGLHTLLFLDIESKENKYMDPSQAIKHLLKMEEKRNEEVVNDDSLLVVISRAGSPNPQVVVGELNELMGYEFGSPLHTIIFPGDLHFREKEALDVFGEN